MKVKDLIKLLSKEDPEAEVILSSDPEGNSYSFFSGDVHQCYSLVRKYKSEEGFSYNGEIELFDEEDLESDDYKEERDKVKKSIVLYP